jgi:hypothetical protein
MQADEEMASVSQNVHCGHNLTGPNCKSYTSDIYVSTEL